MTELAESRAEILESALETLEEGIAVLDRESRVLFWNHSATAMTGYQSADILSRVLPFNTFELDDSHHPALSPSVHGLTPRPEFVRLRHCQGHTWNALLRRISLRDSLGSRVGTLLRFHPTEDAEALPYGNGEEEPNRESTLERSQNTVEDRLEEAWQAWTHDAVPFNLFWIAIDQGDTLLKTHGIDAFDVMFGIIERTLLHGLRPGDFLGRWGRREFLVICHESSAEQLIAHGQHLCEFAQTSEFRWWGDRIPLTVSIGAAQASSGESLSGLMLRTQSSMEASATAGGNRVVLSRSGNTFQTRIDQLGTEGHECSQL